MEQFLSDRIWNRAALEGGGESARVGDRALAALLLAHGLIMNGGVHHALECLSSKELIEAKDGYSFFGFSAVVGLLENALRLDQDIADGKYASLVPDDSALGRRFAELFARSAELFAPLD